MVENARRTNAADISRADGILIYIILIAGSFGGACIAAMGLITGVFRVISPARYPISLLAEIPVETGPGVVQAHGDTVIVTADKLSAGPLWLLAISDLLLALVIACVTASFAYLLYRVVQRRPFHRTMRIAALTAGCAVTIGGMLYQCAQGIGKMIAADELNGSIGGVAVVGFSFQPAVLFIGFGILALAYVFRAGERLQRDAEGLI